MKTLWWEDRDGGHELFLEDGVLTWAIYGLSQETGEFIPQFEHPVKSKWDIEKLKSYVTLIQYGKKLLDDAFKSLNWKEAKESNKKVRREDALITLDDFVLYEAKLTKGRVQLRLDRTEGDEVREYWITNADEETALLQYFDYVQQGNGKLLFECNHIIDLHVPKETKDTKLISAYEIQKYRPKTLSKHGNVMGRPKGSKNKSKSKRAVA